MTIDELVTVFRESGYSLRYIAQDTSLVIAFGFPTDLVLVGDKLAIGNTSAVTTRVEISSLRVVRYPEDGVSLVGEGIEITLPFYGVKVAEKKVGWFRGWRS